MLAARAAGTVGVHAQVRRVDLNLHRVVNFRVHIDRGERGVPPVARIERAFAHQSVHAGLGAQVAEGVVAGDLKRGMFDAGGVACGFFHLAHFELARLGEAPIHAQQHLGPVLRLGAAGAGLDVNKSRVAIRLACEQAGEFQIGGLPV